MPCGGLDYITAVLKVYKYYKQQRKPLSELTTMFGIHKATLYRWLSRYYLNEKKELCDTRKGIIKTLSKKKRAKNKLRSTIVRNLLSYIEKNKQETAKILRKKINKRFKTSYSINHVSKMLRREGITYKRIQKENIYTRSNRFKEQRAILRDNIGNKENPNIISIDETGINLNDTNNYGRSRKNTKCVVNVKSKNKKHCFSLLTAIDKNGVIAREFIRGSFNAVTFSKFIIEKVFPKMNANHKLLMDNALIHRARIFYSELKKAGLDKNRIIYNVPYSPKYNPIEYVFNTMKREIKNTVTTVKELIVFLEKFGTDESTNYDNYYKKSFTHLFDDEEY